MNREDIIDQFDDHQEDNLREWKLFIGTASDYYIPKWMDIKEGRQTISFNVAAFFLGSIWMLYRKMYLAAFIWLTILIIYSVLEAFFIEQFELFEASRAIEFFSNLILTTIGGFYGNWIYLKSTERKIKGIRNSNYSQLEYEQALEKSGGSSIIPPFIGMTLYGLLMYTLIEYI